MAERQATQEQSQQEQRRQSNWPCQELNSTPLDMSDAPALGPVKPLENSGESCVPVFASSRTGRLHGATHDVCSKTSGTDS